MSVNSSSSLPLPPYNIYTFLVDCMKTTTGVYSILSLTAVILLLLLPLYILVLYSGLQRWRQQRSSTTTSHADVFTYHMVFIELISVLGFCLCCWGVHTDNSVILLVSTHVFSINIFGQIYFHILTCVERYLAVVHPVTYRSLKEARGIRMRNVVIGCVWLLCFAGAGVTCLLNFISLIIVTNLFKAFFFIAVTFCSLSVLHVLIRPGPGEGGGGRQQVDKSKLRAFYTIMMILGVLLLRFVGDILGNVLVNLVSLGEEANCGGSMSSLWFSLPSSLVLPLLFLLRAGKLPCFKSNN